MHRALQIPEILQSIFRCHLPRTEETPSNLLALARTCRVFKEPALDALWYELDDPTPLVRCLSEASQFPEISLWNKRYSFARSLTQIEWGILRGYTRRIRRMTVYGRALLDWKSVTTFLNPPATDPLFPNLRHLACGTAVQAEHLLCMPFPSMISLSLEYIDDENADLLRNSVESFAMFSPNIKKLCIHMEMPQITLNDFFSACICRWKNLQTLLCSNIALSAGAFVYLSGMPALSLLEFMLSDTLPDQITDSKTPLLFANLHDLTLYSDFLGPVSRLLFRTRLPAITDFTVSIGRCPSKADISSFLACVQTSGIGHTIKRLSLQQHYRSFRQYIPTNPRPVLGLEDLESFMAFKNLRRINLNIEWNVDVAGRELVALASTRPYLEHLVINKDWGWNTPGGLTPDELLQVLGTCWSLSWIAVAVDTRGYTECRQSPSSIGFALPPEFWIDVVDSRIESKSVPAVTAFLAYVTRFSDITLRAWDGAYMNGAEGDDMRWFEAYDRSQHVFDAPWRRSLD